VGIGFVLSGLLAMAAFWRLGVFWVEVIDVPLGPGALSMVLAGIACLVGPAVVKWTETRWPQGLRARSKRSAAKPKQRGTQPRPRAGDALRGLGWSALAMVAIYAAIEELRRRGGDSDVQLGDDLPAFLAGISAGLLLLAASVHVSLREGRRASP
jgi:hypothetical protein